MKVHISIPNTKKSERFPGKNKVLAHYTLDWLKDEIKYLPKDYEVTINELVSPYTEEYITPYDKFDVPFEDEHQKSLDYLQKHVEAELYVHLQVTQIRRRRGLLKDAIDTFLVSQPDVVSSYVRWNNDTSWRELKRNGDKVMFDNTLRKREAVSLYDGAIYVAKDLNKIFDTDATWDWVHNYCGPVRDIDYQEDI